MIDKLIVNHCKPITLIHGNLRCVCICFEFEQLRAVSSPQSRFTKLCLSRHFSLAQAIDERNTEEIMGDIHELGALGARALPDFAIVTKSALFVSESSHLANEKCPSHTVLLCSIRKCANKFQNVLGDDFLVSAQEPCCSSQIEAPKRET